MNWVPAKSNASFGTTEWLKLYHLPFNTQFTRQWMGNKKLLFHKLPCNCKNWLKYWKD